MSWLGILQISVVYNRTSWCDSSLALDSTKALDPKFDPSYEKGSHPTHNKYLNLNQAQANTIFVII